MADSVDLWTITGRALSRMAEASSPRVILTVFVRAALHLADADLAQVDFYTPSSKRFVSGVAAGRDGNAAPLCPTPHQNALACAVLERERPLFRDLGVDHEGFPERIESVLFYPMLGRLLRGVILIGYERAPSRPVSDITRMLSVLVPQTSVFLRQLDERRRTSTQTARLTLIDEVSRVVVESGDPAAGLRRVLGRMSRTFDLRDALLYTGSPPVLYTDRRQSQLPQGSRLTGGLGQQAYHMGRSLMSNDVKGDARCEAPEGLG